MGSGSQPMPWIHVKVSWTGVWLLDTVALRTLILTASGSIRPDRPCH
jgi:hypothetical protein